MMHEEPQPWYLGAALWSVVGIICAVSIGLHWAPDLDGDAAVLWSLLASVATFQLLSFAIICVFLTRCVPPGDRLQEMNLDQFPRSTPLVAFAGALLLIPIVTIAVVFSEVIMEWRGIPPTTSLLAELLLDSSVAVRIVIIVSSVCIIPLCEEVLFRVVLFRAFAHRVGRGAATVIASALFAAAHWIPEQFLALFLLAVILQIMLNHTRNLWLPILTHTAYNALMIGMFLIVSPA